MSSVFSGDEKKREGLGYLRAYTAGILEKTGAAPRCFVHSFGCQQNVSDGEKLKGALVRAGFEPVDDFEQAELLIFNTCAVRENAEDKVFGVIGDLKRFKERHSGAVICVCGCMAQEEKVSKKLMETYSQVDLVFGTFVGDELYAMLAELFRKRRRIMNIEEKYAEIDEDFVQYRSSSFSAFIPIMYGCNNFCTYCIVPYVRGRERSRAPEAVEAEVRKLVAEGYKEIFLLGQNVNSYSYGFPALLRRLDAIEGDFRIRFMSSHPKDATHELIDTIIGCEKVCKHLHLALQSGNDRILKAMNRRYTAADFYKIIEYARNIRPDFSFSTDIIVGFPGETYEEFCDTKEFIKKVKFDNIYSFVYSRREGTKAAELPDDISDKQKGLWLRELLLENREVQSEWMKRFIGRICRVLIDGRGKEAGMLTGKNDENIIVNLAGGDSLVGQFADVRITGAMNWALKGEIV